MATAHHGEEIYGLLIAQTLEPSHDELRYAVLQACRRMGLMEWGSGELDNVGLYNLLKFIVDIMKVLETLEDELDALPAKSVRELWRVFVDLMSMVQDYWIRSPVSQPRDPFSDHQGEIFTIAAMRFMAVSRQPCVTELIVDAVREDLISLIRAGRYHVSYMDWLMSEIRALQIQYQ
ncbi:unnamed protein product [Mycena citricolor]|uniref:Uncharacterized protein n=1 Tax=Mycena citricolor TaxID=2018698 RepID=A0AAD2K1A5_9AGAR|nr:unnamed protein product [Mycena citricolor]